ncbi:helix-turn-helix domain-containing protein [Conexibacter sp. JD483]|uniref:PucR family transcriptional regulator n=1 Tax=unclassified Conexibacter TaxID=2627773 RepID=UPI002723166D|nr:MULTISPECIES: helix-turn-helix domain-containing protein [unclassified Conexibacter]MDO8188949.1 helix-turn-helix domain-containing protein [Conexibacter sp. CPCC 205706]MDO8201736.1 helix-turn-helix domain-containing protein [Conexibacter sp. CPCC 205762]MDR9371419.1 helix-turn-helix domain-containing protein [Conexibacter sp. JD483]
MTPQTPTVRRLAALSEPLAPSALRGFHAELFDAVLWDGDLDRVVALTAAAVGAPVAIVVPRLQLAHVSPRIDGMLVASVVRHVAERMRGRPAKVPAEVLAEAPIARRGELLGAVLMLAAPDAAKPEDPDTRATLLDCLHYAATATLARVAAIELRASVEQDLHGALLQQLREQPDADPQLVAQRAARLGCDLTHGAVALCVEPVPGRERTAAALIGELHPGALVEPAGARIAALLPLTGDTAALERVRELVTRLEPHGAAGASRHCTQVEGLGEALEEAELVLDVIGLADEAVDLDSAMSGTYRLLFRLLATHPGEVSALFEATVAPLVRYDDHHRTDLVATLATYLELNGNMNATAARIFAHRHTVAYRLDRIRELTGLDPADGEHRERLGLGLKAHRLLRRDAGA